MKGRKLLSANASRVFFESADFNPGHETNLKHFADMANSYHDKALKAHKSSLEYARMAGAWLARARDLIVYDKKGELQYAWMPWVKRHFKGSHRLATDYILIYRRWKELEPNPELSLREALKALRTRYRGKPFDREVILRSQAFRHFLSKMFKEWDELEIRLLKRDLGMDPELEGLLEDMMEKLHSKVQQRLAKLSREEKLALYDKLKEQEALKAHKAAKRNDKFEVEVLGY